MQEKLKLSKLQGTSTPAELKRMQNVPYASAVGSIMYAVRCTRPDVMLAQNVTSRFQQNSGDLYWTTVKNILKYLRNTKDMFLVYGEAEYIAAFDASKEAVWVRKFISGLGITKGARHFRAKVHYLREVIEYGDVKIVLSIEDKLNYLEQPIPPAHVAPTGQHVALEILAAHNAWIKGSKEIAGLMLMTMEPEIQQNLKPLHAHEILKELKTLFAQQAEQELLQTTRDFHSCRQEEGQSVSSYALKMKGYIDNLERLGHPVILGLGLHEQTLPKRNAPVLHAIQAGKNKQAYAPKPKIPPPPKRENPAKDSIYHECGDIGHWKRNCPQYLAELMKKKKNASFGAGGSSNFVIELNTILNRSWIYDTGCGTHICNTTQGLRASRKLKPGALSLYVGNGQRKAVEAINAFYLCLPSGLELVLNNCHYAPSITRGVISVSCLYEDGFVNRFVDNTIQVSRNNVVYFSAVRRDGIFEIDLSNSLTNESSIYVVSNKRAKLDLDSALL
nr:hypothetical protein [Tanacetum cinerariifolium]